MGKSGKAVKQIKKMNLKGVSVKEVNIPKFTAKQKEQIRKARELLRTTR